MAGAGRPLGAVAAVDAAVGDGRRNRDGAGAGCCSSFWPCYDAFMCVGHVDSGCGRFEPSTIEHSHTNGIDAAALAPAAPPAAGQSGWKRPLPTPTTASLIMTTSDRWRPPAASCRCCCGCRCRWPQWRPGRHLWGVYCRPVGSISMYIGSL